MGRSDFRFSLSASGFIPRHTLNPRLARQAAGLDERLLRV
jgi:hypothetical protein